MTILRSASLKPMQPWRVTKWVVAFALSALLCASGHAQTQGTPIDEAAQHAERQEQAAAPAKQEARGKFANGFTWETPDRSSSLSVGSNIQVDYKNFAPRGISTDDWELRRAQLSVSGQLWDYYTFLLQGNYRLNNGNSGTNLDQAFLNVGYWRGAQFRFGQFKMPFSLEFLTSDRFIDLMERSLVNSLAPQEQLGVMVHGQPATGTTYGLAWSTGYPRNLNPPTDAYNTQYDIIGRATVNLAEIFAQKNAVYHLGGAFTSGRIEPLTQGTTLNGADVYGLRSRTEPQGVTFFNVDPFTGSVVDRTRYGLEAAVAHGPMKAQGQWVLADYSGTSAANVSYDRKVDAYYIDLMWTITGERYASSYANGLFGRMVPDNNFKIGSGARGLWEVGARYSAWDGSDFNATNPLGTGVLGNQPGSIGSAPLVTPAGKAHAYTLGVKWIPSPNVRFLLNCVHTEFDTSVVVTPGGSYTGNLTAGHEDAVTFRAQLDF